ncbi:hypothetical protein P3632_23695 [Vibrio parahaemolyticus]|uniref:hypothetical protein n=1 Tax=Vibrio parahaemolyticus TaxID=670 RepID=UPI00114026F8|nr:hypothetical protein [Vibrio parahaemolyticus]MDF5019818.1 hypothetical protein [Vibrio parahaemolyticus]MDF5119485.1 hypothetical protein [Vibrio parahaemolyticus]MDF5183418.1 hypothetical protein [Vibrio parahaemolyticus]MDF5257258.1 hypothetical protein [Vibrio parahaemolyticus]MDF5276386.1 hypothetical protein [Vibrio parahaemolyticus]
MSFISFELMAEHGRPMTYHFNRRDYFKFRELVQCGGKAVLGGHYLESNKKYLVHFKKSAFEGPSYSMPLDGVLSYLDQVEVSMK